VLVKIQGGMAVRPADDALKEPQLPDATMPTQSEQEEATKTLSMDELAVYEEY
jgi:hypothetical protein